jgi:hypothetical protein
MGNLKGRDNLYDLDVDGKMIKVEMKETGWEGLDWRHLIRDSDQWVSFVNTIIEFRFYKFLIWLSETQLLKKDSASWNEFCHTLN